MKWSVVGLLGLGVCAAVCAAILVAGLGNAPSIRKVDGDPNREITVLVASKPLPAMKVIDASCVKEKIVKGDAGLTGIVSSVDVVGKVLARPMVEGEAFTHSAFSEGSGTQLAAMLPHGKRAVAISVTGFGGLEGVLYPGSMVDVLATFRATGSPGVDYREPMTTTLLESVSVLAIEKLTVVNADKERKDDNANLIDTRPIATRRVTLLVDAEQAKALELAMEQGTLSLALRNPLDNTISRRDGIRLREILSDSESNFNHGAANAATAPTAMDAVPARWETVIIRGNSVETRQFSMPVGETPESATN